ncbi:hypothetical protein LINPERHAP1_LOCUS34370 [Linum perenne]
MLKLKCSSSRSTDCNTTPAKEKKKTLPFLTCFGASATTRGATASAYHFPLRNDIFPCTVCGEILQKPHLLEQHLTVKQAVSELRDGDSGNNIIQKKFKAGEFVKSKASKISSIARKPRDERCIADGNELLRFHCAAFVCDLGLNGGGEEEDDGGEAEGEALRAHS